MQKRYDLSDRVILVTGAGSGIGAAVSRALAAHGASVVLLGHRIAELERVYDQIEAAGGPRPAICPLNLESIQWEEYERLASTLEQEYGRLDGLLHNAAHLSGLTPLALYDPQDWVRTVQINLNAPFFITRCCLPLLQEASDASVLFTSDDMGRHGRAYAGAYGASKFGLEGLAKTLAEETEVNTAIRSNSIDPGPVRTALRERIQFGPELDELPRPEDVVEPFLFLLGPDSRGITGQAFAAQGQGPWSRSRPRSS